MKKYALPAVAVLLILFGLGLRHAEEIGGLFASAPTAVVIVEETADRTPAQALVLLSLEARKAAKAAGVSFRIADKDASGPDVAEIQWALDAAKTVKPLPVVVSRRNAGKAKVVPLTTEAALVKIIKGG